MEAWPTLWVFKSTEVMRPLAARAARQEIGREFMLFYDRLDEGPLLGAHRSVIQHARYGGDGDACLLRDFDDGHGFLSYTL
jgi:hypothetical protein